MPDTSFLRWPFFEQEHAELWNSLREWASRELDLSCGQPHTDESSTSKQLVTRLGESNWLRFSVPAPYGGAFERLDVRSLCLGREVLAYVSGLADFAFAMQGLGSGPVSLFGSEEQKNRFLPAVAAGQCIPAFALSEADAGSDVASIKSSAVLDGADYVLNGSKCWISNAGIAGFYVVFARTGEAPGARGLSAFIVEIDRPGLEFVESQKVTSPHPLGVIRMSDCRVPKENLIGEAGKGFHIAMGTLDVFRSTVGAAALGFARRALDEALAHTSERELFGQKLFDFQMTQASIAEMATAVDMSALLVYRAAWAKDSGADRVTREAAMAKMQATEFAQSTIDRALQLLGGKGLLSESVLERLYRDIRPLRIYEGTTEIQKIVIARQAMKDFEQSRTGE